MLSTRGTTWDKLDDREAAGGEGGEVSHAESSAAAAESLGDVGGTDASDRGSQIELVLQGHGHGHHHETTVSSNWDRRGSIEEGREEEERGPSTSKEIMVVRTVDVSSRDGGDHS